MKERQTDKILRHMLLHGSITPIDALQSYGCMRLAARIADLRKDGVLITAELEKGVNRDGEKIVYTRYRIAEG
jgi:hypothetical protein